MAQVTVQQLAEVVGASVDRLLTQMGEAGLPHTKAEEAVSDEDKQTLLAYLKRSHGESTKAPKKITLKRKTISTLKGAGSQGKKTVNVEVRKKRTYVKREETEQDLEELPVEVEEEVAAPEPVAEVVAPAAETDSAQGIEVDPEVLRQQAATKRKAQEAAAKEAEAEEGGE